MSNHPSTQRWKLWISRRTTRPRTPALLIVGILVLGGMSLRASAADTGTASSFVAIAPCRIFDTRPSPDGVGARMVPLGSDETFTADVWGVRGNCALPVGANAVSMNVVAVSPTAESYLTVFPGGSARPLASSLNWVAGQAPTPNAVTAAVSTTGTLSFYNHAGTVHLAVDVVGYYLPASSGGTGPAGPVGPPGPAGPAVASVIWVATSGGQYTSVRQALASITDNGPGHRYLVMVGPGTYVEWSTIDLKDYVDLQGSGQDVTTIICNCAATLTSATIAASGPVHSELRNLTVTNSGGGNGPIGVSLTNVTAAMSIVDTTITAANASPFSGGFGLYLTGSVQPHLDALNVYINITGSYAVYAGFFGNIVVVRNSWIYSTAGPSVGAGGSLVRLVASTVNGNTTGLSGRCDLVVDVSGNPFTCN